MTVKTRRYEKVINARQKTALQLQEAMQLTQEAYNEVVFETGVKLLDSYFGEAKDERIYSRLLKQENEMYWAWYINQREQWQEDFWKGYAPLFAHIAAVEGIKYASDMLVNDWKDDNEQFCNDTVIMERLKQFILNMLR